MDWNFTARLVSVIGDSGQGHREQCFWSASVDLAILDEEGLSGTFEQLDLLVFITCHASCSSNPPVDGQHNVLAGNSRADRRIGPAVVL